MARIWPTHIDLVIEFRREFGRDPKGNEEWIAWLEDQLIKHKRHKKYFLPWEPLEPKYRTRDN